MSAGGWIMMICSWLFVIVLSGFCMRKVFALRQSDAKHIKPIRRSLSMTTRYYWKMLSNCSYGVMSQLGYF